MRKFKEFSKRVLRAAFNRVKSFIISCYTHSEAVVILTLAALGLNALMSEIPFAFSVPLWIEAPLIIPVASVLTISLILKSSEFRANRRLIHATA